MDKQLHSFLLADQHSNPLPEPHHTIQNAIMEEEYASELALLQTHKLNPRPEAVQQLLQIITRNSIAPQH